MAKYICSGCDDEEPCVLEIADGDDILIPLPGNCPFSGGVTKWVRVKEDDI